MTHSLQLSDSYLFTCEFVVLKISGSLSMKVISTIGPLDTHKRQYDDVAAFADVDLGINLRTSAKQKATVLVCDDVNVQNFDEDITFSTEKQWQKTTSDNCACALPTRPTAKSGEGGISLQRLFGFLVFSLFIAGEHYYDVLILCLVLLCLTFHRVCGTNKTRQVP